MFSKTTIYHLASPPATYECSHSPHLHLFIIFFIIAILVSKNDTSMWFWFAFPWLITMLSIFLDILCIFFDKYMYLFPKFVFLFIAFQGAYFVSIFSYSHVSFHVFKVYFRITNLFSNTIHFFVLLLDYIFSSLSKKSLPNSRSWNFCFSVKVLFWHLNLSLFKN